MPTNAAPSVRSSPTPSPSKPTVLVVEDRREVLEVVVRMLSANGFTVHTATDGVGGLNAALDLLPDILILDLGLPKQNGLQVARELRSRGFTAPVLILTARDSIADKVSGFDAGADDYLPKPFDCDELLARVRALLRRATMRADMSLLRVGNLTIDPIARAVSRGERAIPLTQKEYALLEYLARNAGRTLARETIFDQVWKQPFDPASNIVDVYVNYLRKKLDGDDPSEPALLHTVRGVGYMLRS